MQRGRGGFHAGKTLISHARYLYSNSILDLADCRVAQKNAMHLQLSLVNIIDAGVQEVEDTLDTQTRAAQHSNGPSEKQYCTLKNTKSKNITIIVDHLNKGTHARRQSEEAIKIHGHAKNSPAVPQSGSHHPCPRCGYQTVLVMRDAGSRSRTEFSCTASWIPEAPLIIRSTRVKRLSPFFAQRNQRRQLFVSENCVPV